MANKFLSKLRSKAITWLNKDGEPEPRQPYPAGIACLNACSPTVSYDNNFPNITRIAESFAEISPYAVDANGKKLSTQPHLIDVLNHPNSDMSDTDFREILITMLLVHPTVYLLCWRKDGRRIVPGGNINANNIAALTFMEGVGVSTIGDQVTYYYEGNTYSTSEVIALSLHVNPYNLLSGYSPSMAAKKWATVDDYVADYQAGYFRNGAVPAGQFVVTAPTADEFNRMVDILQAHHRGANNANNPNYVHRPTSAIDGKPMAAQVEWVPFAQSSVEGALQSIFDQANKKIDMVFGVPEEVKGYLQNSNYASAEVADYVFSRYVLYPKLRKVWSKLTHEFNRIFGGMGFALDFDFEFPGLTDMRKVQAETLTTMLNAGFTVESSVEALRLPSSFKKLKKAETQPVVEQTAATDPTPEPETDTSATNSEKSLKKKDLEITEEIEEPETANPLVRSSLNQYLNAIIDKAIDMVKKRKPEKEADVRELREQLLDWLTESGLADDEAQVISTILTSIILEKGEEAILDFAASLDIADLHMSIPTEQLAEIIERLKGLIKKFGEDTIINLGDYLIRDIDSGTEDLVATLERARSMEEYRVDRWATSETHYAEEEAVIIAAIVASEQTELVPYKTWQVDPTSADMCIHCLSLDGETVALDQPFSNGNMIPHDHPWCRCRAVITWRPAIKSVKVTCPACGRYMMESTGGVMKNVICANSKCKKHYDITVEDGKVKATEFEIKHQTEQLPAA